MALKKTVASKKTVDAKKTIALRAKAANPATTASAAAPVVATAAAKSVWTVPIAALALIVASGGLWLAVRESSTATQAAAPPAAHPVMTSAMNDESARPAPVTADTPKPAETTPSGSVKPVSITGCLQRGGDNGFVLKDTEGTAAPKARSWKSGFLRKSSAAVELRDAGDTAHLGSHVGQRVSLTGPLADREMQVRSLHRVSASCQ
jgi:hypothetical protein